MCHIINEYYLNLMCAYGVCVCVSRFRKLSSYGVVVVVVDACIHNSFTSRTIARTFQKNNRKVNKFFAYPFCYVYITN